MTTVDAIFADGVFKPVIPVAMPENQRVRLTVETVVPGDLSQWLAAVRTFQGEVVARRGVLPDCTSEIASDRRHHE
jgi:predicted DNA-binding antitoxin AbrB/MazE fold protein